MFALVSIGPAVLNGGITTFLALILLGQSESNAFIIFFKVTIYLSERFHFRCSDEPSYGAI